MEPNPMRQPDDDSSGNFNHFMQNKISEIENTEEGIHFLQNALKETKERFDILYQTAPFSFDTLDENAHIIDVNKTWLNSLGYVRREVIGRPLTDFLTPECKLDMEEHWEGLKEAGSVNDVHLKFVRKDGSVLDTTTYAKVLYDGNGKIFQIHGISYDLTEQKKADAALRKSEREKALILGIMSDRVIYLDPDLKVIWANKNLMEPFHSNLEKLVGTPCYQTLYGRETPCVDCLVVKSLKSLCPEQGELVFGGTSLAAHAYPVLDHEGALTGFVQVSQEITARKHLERDILDISTKAQQSLGRDLHDGLGQLLTGLAFLSRVLHSQLSSQSLPEAADAAKVADIAERALSLTRNLAKGLYPDGLDADGYLGAIADLAMNTEALYGITCSFNPETTSFHVDKGLSIHLYYIAQEAINNAVKHGKAKNIRITLTRRDGNVTLTVQDDGKGLQPSSRRGKGMGLRTMSYRASVLGGKLMIQNNPDRGATLTCSFPLAKGSK
jgi:PAS domain S-box-containing protein